MDLASIKQGVCQAIDDRRDHLLSLGEQLFSMPELGFKEYRTARVMADEMQALGLQPRTGVAVTGVVSQYGGGVGQPVVAIMGELDAVVCPGHPQADPETGAAHSCGHNAQLTSVIGAAVGLVGAGVAERLGGGIRFMAVPAEEYVEIGYRRALRQAQTIEFMGGKQEFIRLGEFDDVAAALMMHLSSEKNGKKLRVGGTSNGFLGKFVRYLGTEAHAGGAPHAGVNALNAAALGIMGIHCLRETFRDEDSIRVHPIITSGGDLVNIVPADVTMETYVRGRSLEAIADANGKVNRALKAAAMAIGGEVEIDDLPGYLPRRDHQQLQQLVAANAAYVLGEGEVESHREHGGGSTDFGDLTQLIPGAHPSVGAASGRGHAEDYAIADPQLAYVDSGKILALTAIDLLWNGAEELRLQQQQFDASHTRESYLDLWRQMTAG